MLEDDSGKANAVTPEALAELFSLCSHFVECVVLNACHTRTQADAISRNIPYVIGMDKSIGDRAAIRYAVGFYDALGAGMAYGYAHSLGCNLLRLENIPEHLTPVLRASPEAIPAKTDFRILGRMSREEIDGTLRQYKAAVAAGTEDGDAHLSLGLLYLHLGLHDPAMRHFRRALDLDPALADGYYYLALASVRGRRPKALMLQEVRAIERHVAAAIELDERPAKYYYFLAAVKQDYYSANGLRAPVPSVPTLLDLAASRDHDVWEIERLLSLLPLGDNELLARIRR
jgi:tetratricopeptide (TPR) repeat protein